VLIGEHRLERRALRGGSADSPVPYAGHPRRRDGGDTWPTCLPPEILDPRATWADPASYDARAQKLAGLFQKNFEEFSGVSRAVREAGPRLG